MALAVVQKLYMNEDERDVVFHVGQDEDHRVRFPAHKLVLAVASPIFSAMFNENYRERETGQVYITDITPTAFQNLLKFAYFGKFEALTVASYTDAMHASDKYFMPKLSEFCLSKLENFDICFDNFWNFFTIICRYYSESMSPKIVTNTLEFLDENADVILQSIEFQHLNSEAVITILKRSTLKNTSEIDILRHVLQWSNSACARHNLEICAQNEHKMLKDVRFYIRYLLIPRAKLLSEVTLTAFLNQNDRATILDKSLNHNQYPVFQPPPWQIKYTDGLPQPWDNNLLRKERGRNSTMKFNIDTIGTSTAPIRCTNFSSCSLLLVAAYDCVFEGLKVYVSLSGAVVSGDIVDMEGKIYDVWTEPSVDMGNGIAMVGKSFCLKKFKAYKLNLVCVNGHLLDKRQATSYLEGYSGDIFLYLKNFPNGSSLDLKSSEYWEKYFTYKIPIDSLYYKTVVKSVTIKI